MAGSRYFFQWHLPLGGVRPGVPLTLSAPAASHMALAAEVGLVNDFPQRLECYEGEDRLVTVTVAGVAADDPADGWNVRLAVAAALGDEPLVIKNRSAFTWGDNGATSGTATGTVALSAGVLGQTLGPGNFKVEFARTDAGAARVRARGELFVEARIGGY